MRHIVRLVAAALFAAPLTFIAAPAMAGWACTQQPTTNGYSNHCRGTNGTKFDYRTVVICWSGQFYYELEGPWRSSGGPNPSVANCGGGLYQGFRLLTRPA